VNCDTARIYAGAVADGEVDGVPAPILEHIRQCHDCSTEVQWQREAQVALAAAIAGKELRRVPAAQPAHSLRSLSNLPFVAAIVRRRSLAFAGAAAAVVLLLITATVAGLPGRLANPGPGADAAMRDAASAYGRPAAFTSTDPAAISGWSAGRGMPAEVVALPDETVTGARVSTVEGHQVLTIIYTGPRGTTEVSVIPAAMAGGWPTMEAKKVGNAPVGLVRRSGDSMLIVAPDDAGLHQAMTTLQA